MTAFLLSLLMLILYIKNEKFKYFALSCFFMGICFASKYEYSLFMFVLIFYAVKKHFTLKQTLYSALSFISIPLLSLMILILQGCGFQDLYSAFKYMAALSKTQSLEYFYSYIGCIPSIYSIARNSVLFDRTMFFSSFGIFAILITIFSFKTKDIKYIILCLSSVLASLKAIFSISLNIYGTFFLPAILLVISIFIYRYRNKKIIFIPYLIFILISVFLYAYFDIKTFEDNRKNKTEYNGNKIYTDNKYFADRYNEIIKYIEVNTNKNDKILVLPEGVILNFLTQRISDNKYYYLIPPNVELFKQEQIISDLQKAPPEIIIIFSNQYYWYNTGSFESEYGNKIHNYIKDNYDIDENNSGMYDKIYKLKDKQ